MAASDARRFAREIADLRRRLEAMERASQMGYVAVEGGTVEFYDDEGNLRQRQGVQDDGSYTIVDLNAPPPLPPYEPLVEARAGVLVVTANGAFEDGSTPLSDFARWEVHVATTPGFEPDDDTQVAEFTSRRGGAVTLALPEVEHYVVLTAVNTSGAESLPSVEVAATPLPVATGAGGTKIYHTEEPPVGLGADDDALWYDIDNGNKVHYWDGALLDWIFMPVGAEAIADGAVTTAKIGDQAVDLSKLADGSVDAAKLVTDAVTPDKASFYGEVTTAQQTADAAQTDATQALADADAAAAAAAAAQTDATNAANAAAVAQDDADAAAQAAADAETKALEALGVANDKADIVYASAAPTGDPNVYWVDLDTGRGHRWDGTNWIEIQDEDVQTALANAATADSKAQAAQADATAAQQAATTAQAAADAAQADATQALSDAATADAKAVQAQQDADAARGVADQAVADAAAAQSDADAAATAAAAAQGDADAAAAAASAAQADATQALSDADAAEQQALNALGVANSKADIVYQATAPAGDPTTYWVDTDTGRGHRWDGTNWVEIQDEDVQTALSNAAAADAKAQNAQQAADTADAKAVAAQADADAAASAAAAAQSDANAAQSDATQALSDAAAAQADASQALADAGDAAGAAAAAQQAADLAQQTANAADATANQAVSDASAAQSTADQALSDANNITSTQITDNAITTPKITAGAVIAAKIAADAVTADKILAGAVTTAKIDAGAITSGKIAADAVVAGKIAADAVTAGTIAANAVVAGTVAADAIGANQIAANAVIAGKIAADAVDTAQIRSGAIVSDSIAANAITSTKIEANAVTAGKIAADAVLAENIKAGEIQGVHLDVETITADKIKAGEITADKIALAGVESNNMAFGAFGGVLGNAVPDPRFNEEGWRQRRLSQGGPEWGFEDVVNLAPTSTAGWEIRSPYASLSMPAPLVPGTVDIEITGTNVPNGEVLLFSDPIPIVGTWDQHGVSIGNGENTSWVTTFVDVLDANQAFLYGVEFSADSDNVTVDLDGPAEYLRVRVQANQAFTGTVRLRGLALHEHNAAVRVPQRLLTCTAPAAGEYRMPVVRGVPMTPGMSLRTLWESTALAGTPHTEVVLVYRYRDGSETEYPVWAVNADAIWNHHWMSIWAGPHDVPNGAVSVGLDVLMRATGAGDKVAFSNSLISSSGEYQGGFPGIIQPDMLNLGHINSGADVYMNTFAGEAWISGHGTTFAGFWDGSKQGAFTIHDSSPISISPDEIDSSRPLVITAPSVEIGGSTVEITAPAEGWQNLNLGPNWGTRGTRAAFCKDAAGVVHLRGWVDPNNQDQGDVLGTLPVGFRPSADLEGITVAASSQGFAALNVMSDGRILAYDYDFGAGEYNWVSLNNISFPTF